MPLDLHIRDSGSGDPVVILHGLLGNAANWQRPAKALAERHRVLAVDLRNHGRSPHTDTMTLSEMAQDVRELLAARGLRSASVIGHSLGGKVAMTLALETPDWIDRLVVVDIAPVDYPDKGELAHIVASLRRLPLAEITDLADADRRLATDLPSATLRGFLLTNLKSGADGYSWRVNLEAIATVVPEIRSFPPALQRAQCPAPTLFVAGSLSDYVQPAHDAVIHSCFPQAQVVTIEGGGHWVHSERAEAFMAAVTPFLAGVPVAAASVLAEGRSQ